jgi:hypothetical protein
MTTICAYPIKKVAHARICGELADGFWGGTSYCVAHLALVACGKG